MTDEDNHAVELAELTADVVSAYVANNPLPVANLPDVIASVHASLSGLNSQIAPAAKELVPAAKPKKSVFGLHHLSRRRKAVQIPQAAHRPSWDDAR